MASHPDKVLRGECDTHRRALAIKTCLNTCLPRVNLRQINNIRLSTSTPGRLVISSMRKKIHETLA